MKARVIIAMAALGISAAAYAGVYKVNANVGAAENGKKATIVNYDSGEQIDSVEVVNGTAVFKGDIDEPIMVRMRVDGGKPSDFILEEGSIAVDNGDAKGSMLNDRLNEVMAQIMGVADKVRNSESQEEAQKYMAEYEKVMDAAMRDNIDNPIGYYLLINMAYDMEPEEVEALAAANPNLQKSMRLSKLIEANRKLMATAEGKMFVDFETTYEGETFRLSDYVGKGKPVLVDFWASWCGPCMRQTPYLKSIYEKYGDKLDVIGVAVWDEPQNTKAAISRHNIPWKCVLDAQSIPTDIYGISGIPCIILFGTDGTIVSRGLQSEALEQAVDAYMAGIK